MAVGFSEASKVPEDPDSGMLPRGKMYHIACKSWSTSEGKVLPLSFKFEGDDGSIILVSNIQTHYCEDKNFSGIPSKEFGCEAIIAGLIRNFKLILYCEACKWVMLVPEA